MAPSVPSISRQNPNEDEDPFKNIAESRALFMATLFLLAMAIRAAIGLHPYSGMSLRIPALNSTGARCIRLCKDR